MTLMYTAQLVQLQAKEQAAAQGSITMQCGYYSVSSGGIVSVNCSVSLGGIVPVSCLCLIECQHVKHP